MYVLKSLFKLEIFCAGVSNLTYSQSIVSRWASRLKVNMLHPGITTTLTIAGGRVIDFGFLSVGTQVMFQYTTPIHAVWGPHRALTFAFNAKPKSIYALVHCIPKTLPMERFNMIWKKMSEDDQESI